MEKESVRSEQQTQGREFNTRKINSISVYNYLDYREFLRDLFSWKRSHQKGYSMRQFCLRLGLSTDNYFNRILTGQKNLGRSTAERLMDYLQFDSTQRHYFGLLLTFDQANDLETKCNSLEAIKTLQKKKKVHSIAVDNSIFRDWHTMVLLELSRCKGFEKAGIEDLRRSLRKRVSAAEVQEALRYLEERKYLTRNSQGLLEYSAHRISSTEGVSEVFLRLNHRENLLHAVEALDEPLDQRGNWGFTLAVDKRRIPALKARLKEVMMEILEEFDVSPYGVSPDGTETGSATRGLAKGVAIEAATDSAKDVSKDVLKKERTSALDQVLRVGCYFHSQAELKSEGS